MILPRCNGTLYELISNVLTGALNSALQQMQGMFRTECSRAIFIFHQRETSYTMPNDFQLPTRLGNIRISVRRSLKAKRIAVRYTPRKENKFELVVPWNCPYEEALKFAQGTTEWVEKIIEQKAEEPQPEPAPQYMTRELLPEELNFPILGGTFRVVVCEDENREPFIKLDTNEKQLILNRITGIPIENVQKSFRTILTGHARIVLTPLMEEQVRRTGLSPARLTFRVHRSKWGSCNSRKMIALNALLLFTERADIDYVLVHELCHLKQPNHSERFWALVEQFCPNHVMHRAELNRIQQELPKHLIGC